MGDGGEVHDDVDAVEEWRPVDLVLKIGQSHPFNSVWTGDFGRPARRRPDAMASFGQSTDDGRADEARRAGDQYPKCHPLNLIRVPAKVAQWKDSPPDRAPRRR